MSTTDEVRLATDLPLWEVPTWRERFGISAGITGRQTAAGAPFDLGLWSDRPVGETMRDWRRFRRVFPESTAMAFAHQVHGNQVLWHEVKGAGWQILEGADGHITALEDLLLLATVADCIPIYLAAPAHGVVALLHAGWRGTAAGILHRAMTLFQARGIAAGDVVMHAGVGIAGSSYEVGREVMDGIGAPAPGTGPWQLDLREVLAAQGAAQGIGEITISGHDTANEREAFYSHRASGGSDGRMVAWIGRLSAE